MFRTVSPLLFTPNILFRLTHHHTCLTSHFTSQIITLTSHLILPHTSSHLPQILFCFTHYHSPASHLVLPHTSSHLPHILCSPHTSSHLPHILFCLPQTALDALFVCFCEDVCRNNGTDQPYFMSDNMMVRLLRFLWFCWILFCVFNHKAYAHHVLSLGQQHLKFLFGMDVLLSSLLSTSPGASFQLFLGVSNIYFLFFNATGLLKNWKNSTLFVVISRYS